MVAANVVPEQVRPSRLVSKWDLSFCESFSEIIFCRGPLMFLCVFHFIHHFYC
jgi:hypothetical protein